jgi:PIN domain nuclease of toxin-antitoxin system
MPTAERVVLDTHVLLWWKADRRRLSTTARRHLDETPELLISPLTFWEVAMLVRKERVALDRATTAWAHDVLAEPRTALAPVSPDIAVAAAELADFHGDPVDRILAATAEKLRCPLLTKDRLLRDYAKGRALDAVW